MTDSRHESPQPQPLADLQPPVGGQFRMAGDPALGVEWGVIAPLKPMPPDMPPYPIDQLPDPLRSAIIAACIMARCSYGTAHICALGALSAVVMQDYQVATLAPDITGKPTALFTFGVSESGWRKSTAANIFFAPHTQADADLVSQWQRAKSEFNAPTRSAEDTEDKEPADPTPHPPFRVMNDATVESMMQHLSDSKRCAVLMNDDAAAAISNWSGSKGQQGRTLSILNRLYDGQNANDARIGRDANVVINRRIAVTWLIQRNVGLPFLLSDSSENGFSARSLPTMDFTRPKGPETQNPNGYKDEQLWGWIRGLTDIIADCRARQDAGQYTRNGVMAENHRRIILLSDTARQLLDDYNRSQERAADESLLQGYNHVQAFQVRSAENAARIAAILAALRGYIETGLGPNNLPVSPPEVSAAEMSAAITLMRYHEAALAIMNALNFHEEQAQASRDCAELIIESYGIRDKAATHTRLWDADLGYSTVRLNTLLSQHGRGQFGQRLREAGYFRHSVIDLLSAQDYIRPATQRGRWLVHPDLLNGTVRP